MQNKFRIGRFAMKVMPSFIRKLLVRVQQHSAQIDNKQRLVGFINLIVIVTSLIGGSVMFYYDMNSYLSLFALGLLGVVGWILNRTGHQTSAALLILSSLLVAIQFNILEGFGIHDVAIIAWPAFIFFAGLLFGSPLIPYATGLIMALAVVTKFIPNAQFSAGYSDTGDLVVMLLILLAFSFIAMWILHSDEHSKKNLKRSEERFQAIYNSINDAILIHDYRTGEILDVNDRMLEMFGYTHEEALRLDVQALSSGVQPFTQEVALEWIGKAFTGGAQHFEWQAKTREGRLFWVDINMKRASITDQDCVLVSVRDITEQKRSEEARNTAEADYRAVFEHATIGIFQSSPEGRFLTVNPAMARIYGYDSAEEMLASITDIGSQLYVNQSSRQDFGRQLLERGEVTEFIGEDYRKDRSVIWTVTRARAVKDAQGGVLYYEGFISDITERMRAEEALRESDRILRQAQEIAHIGHFKFNPATGSVEGSEEMFRIFGLAKNQFLFSDFANAVHPDDRARDMASIESAIANQTEYAAEHRLLMPDGSLKWISMIGTFSLSPHQDKPLIIGTVQDITDRKQAERHVSEITERLKEAQEIAMIGNWELDLADNKLFWSDEIYRIFEIDPANFVATYEAFLDAIHPGDRDAVNSAYTSSLETRSAYDIDHRLLMRDGRVKFVHERCRSFFDEEGRPTRSVGTVQDISGRKQREDELVTIASLSSALRSAPKRSDMLPVIVRQLAKMLSCDSISAEIIDMATGESVVEAAYGTCASLVGFRQPLRTGLNAVIQARKEPYLSNRIAEDPRLGIPAHFLEGIPSGAGVPLVAQDQLIGFLWIGRKKEIDESELRLLTAVADIAANAMHRATSHEKTQETAAELRVAYDTTLEGWTHALELRDQETEGHARRVVEMTVALSRAMGVGEAELEHVRRGALLHDIGKMGIPDSVLLKPGTLDEREWEIMRRHPEYAYNLLEPIEYLRPVLDIPYCHHEKWDGSGYPRGFKGEEIPLVARIFAVVDVWDALRSDRPYRKAWDSERSYKHVQGLAGKHFDPEVVSVFLKMVDRDFHEAPAMAM